MLAVASKAFEKSSLRVSDLEKALEAEKNKVLELENRNKKLQTSHREVIGFARGPVSTTSSSSSSSSSSTQQQPTVTATASSSNFDIAEILQAEYSKTYGGASSSSSLPKSIVGIASAGGDDDDDDNFDKEVIPGMTHGQRVIMNEMLPAPTPEGTLMSIFEKQRGSGSNAKYETIIAEYANGAPRRRY